MYFASLTFQGEAFEGSIINMSTTLCTRGGLFFLKTSLVLVFMTNTAWLGESHDHLSEDPGEQIHTEEDVSVGR